MGKILQILIYSVLIILVFVFCGYFFRSCSSTPVDNLVDTAQEVTDNIADAGGEVIAKAENASEDLVEEFEGTEIDYSNNDDSENEEKSFKTTPNVEEVAEEIEAEQDEEQVEEVKYLAQDEEETKPVEAKPVIKKEVPEQSLGSGGNYLLITGNYSQEFNADAMVKRLNSLGFSKAEKIIFDGSKFYTVIAGKYPTANSATSAQGGLVSIDSYVQRKRL